MASRDREASDGDDDNEGGKAALHQHTSTFLPNPTGGGKRSGGGETPRRQQQPAMGHRGLQSQQERSRSKSKPSSSSHQDVPFPVGRHSPRSSHRRNRERRGGAQISEGDEETQAGSLGTAVTVATLDERNLKRAVHRCYSIYIYVLLLPNILLLPCTV